MPNKYEETMIRFLEEEAGPEVRELHEAIKAEGLTWFEFEEKVLPTQPWAFFLLMGGCTHNAQRCLKMYVTKLRTGEEPEEPQEYFFE